MAAHAILLEHRGDLGKPGDFLRAQRTSRQKNQAEKYSARKHQAAPSAGIALKNEEFNTPQYSALPDGFQATQVDLLERDFNAKAAARQGRNPKGRATTDNTDVT